MTTEVPLEIVGKSVPRNDGIEKVTGRTKFTGDLKVPDILHGKILRSPYAHAKITKVDTSNAEESPGVLAVVTHKDSPRILQGELWCRDGFVLEDCVRHVGDEVAAVAAVDARTAETALKLIEVSYEPLSSVFTPEEALRPGAPVIPPDEVFAADAPLIFSPGVDHTVKENLCKQVARYIDYARGDVVKGFAEAEINREDEYKTNFVVHASMERRACLASWEGGKLTVIAPSQMGNLYRKTIATTLDLDFNKVRFISPPLGGSFGGKYEGRYGLIAALLARKAGRPVRIEFSREEEFLARMRPSSEIHLKIGVKKDGTITAIQAKMLAASGAYDGSIDSEACVPIGGLTRCPNIKHEGRSAYTNHPPTGEMRGVNNLLMNFAINQQFDQLAEDLGMDTVEFILKNAIQTGDLCASYWEVMRGAPDTRLSSCALQECIRRSAERIGWKEKRKKPGTVVDGARKRGVGMGIWTHHSAWSTSFSSAIVKLNEDGTVHLIMGASEQGQGITTTACQVAAEVLGVALEDIIVTTTDTETGVFDIGTVGSLSAHLSLKAVKQAAEDVRRQLFEHAAKMMEVPPDQLETRQRRIFVKSSPEKGLALTQLTDGWPNLNVVFIGRATVETPYYPTKARAFGADFVEVQVDTETGNIEVLRYVAAVDCGKAVNPSIVEGQIQGGVVMGLGQALSEELIFDAETGTPLNANLVDYRIRKATEVPIVEPIIVETNDPLGPYGAKGFAEGPNIGVCGAVANAIYNAIGVRIKELPITPEKVLRAIKGAL